MYHKSFEPSEKSREPQRDHGYHSFQMEENTINDDSTTSLRARAHFHAAMLLNPDVILPSEHISSVNIIESQTSRNSDQFV